ncbi:unnamed protein product [Linum tenue]|uniref:Cation/H+ exchanger transmembrane domain-containing protein n=1 Tax=Linum tenue TaxID=586396 RepID=A0AAV0H1S9_9ROSI|nr:unnamed protein product [Linum tenue]
MLSLLSYETVGENVSPEHPQVVPITIFVAVLCLCLVIGHLLEENRWVNESITAIFIGGLTGILILVLRKGQSSHLLRFSEELFFIYLLPPIIFNAGFQVKKKQFFQNFITIMLFGIVGVFISTVIISLAIGTIFSSTDTVCTLQVLHQDETPLLYSIVFGEGVVNDATSVVLFNAVQKMDVSKINSQTILSVIGDFLYLFSTSTALGIGVSVHRIERVFLIELYLYRQRPVSPQFLLFRLASSLHLCLKHSTLGSKYPLLGKVVRTHEWELLSNFLLPKKIALTKLVSKILTQVLSFENRHSSIRELAMMVLMAYLSYMLAELLELSGILTVFFCGIIMSHYSWHNVTESSRITARHVSHQEEHVFAMLSFVAETFIFLYVGMDAFDIEKWKMTKLSLGTSLGIYSSIVFLILVGRAVFVFPLSAFSNFMNRRKTSPLTFKQQVGFFLSLLLNCDVGSIETHSIPKITFSLYLGTFISCADCYLVGWPNERCCLYRSCFQTVAYVLWLCMQFTYSGVTLDPINATMITNTIIVVLFTTLVFGFLTKPLVNYLITHRMRNQNNRGGGSGGEQPRSPKDDVVLPLLSFDESASANMQIARESFSLLMDRPVYTIHHYWRRFDNAYMRPIFGGPRHSRSEC